VAEVTQLMRDGLEQIAADGITEVELRRARGQILGGSTLALESTDSRMNRLGRAEFMGVYRDLDETERLLNLVTPDTVRAVAAELAEQSYTVSAVGDVTEATFAHLA
jgi:predicted Zn-dependent peptidase